MKKREEKVLLYHFPEGKRLVAIQTLLQTLGIEHDVLPEAAWGQTIGYLLGLKGFQEKEALLEDVLFPHEVMIFYQIQDRRLDQVLEAFRKATFHIDKFTREQIHPTILFANLSHGRISHSIHGTQTQIRLAAVKN